MRGMALARSLQDQSGASGTAVHCLLLVTESLKERARLARVPAACPPPMAHREADMLLDWVRRSLRDFKPDVLVVDTIGFSLPSTIHAASPRGRGSASVTSAPGTTGFRSTASPPESFPRRRSPRVSLSTSPPAAAAWKRLFAWLQAKSGVDMTVIDHAFPASLDELWSRKDLACTFMCGWPFMRYGAVHQVVAAPIPSADYAKGRPVYCSHFVVRDDAPFKTLEDTFRHRFAYTIPDSHSGYNAPRHHLLKYQIGRAHV